MKSAAHGCGPQRACLLARVLVLAVLAPAALAPTVFAQHSAELPIDLQWHRASASHCISRARLTAEAAALMPADPPQVSGGPRWSIRGQVRLEDQRWTARLAVYTPDGTFHGVRELRADANADCTSLDGPLAVVVATLLDELGPPPQPAGDTWALALGLFAAGSLGTLPGPAAGATLAMRADPPGDWPPLRLNASVFLPQAVREPDGHGARIYAAAAELTACPARARAQRFGWELCAGASMGVLHARGLGLDRPASPTRLSALALAETGVAYRLVGPLSLELSVGVGVALTRPQFSYVARDESVHLLFRPALLSGSARFGIIVRGR